MRVCEHAGPVINKFCLIRWRVLHLRLRLTTALEPPQGFCILGDAGLAINKLPLEVTIQLNMVIFFPVNEPRMYMCDGCGGSKKKKPPPSTLQWAYA